NTMIVPANLLDRVAVGATVTTVLNEWGRIDVLVNNARFTGPGHMDSVLDTPTEYIDKTMEANFFAPVALCRLILRGMIERGSGWIVNITSRAAYDDPSAPPGKGGWGFIYGASKAALYRVAGSINIEVGDLGVHAVNVDPGLVASERVLLETGAFGIPVEHGGPPDAIGAAVAWLVTDPCGPSLAHGGVIHAQQLCHEHSLLPGWPGPKPIPRSTSDV
ncbi:MAG TPA: SDR family oxidoreductase, partial [Ilumatobacter sp.]|nr:SDR family oxidoreductase [Ilumatobacter sp.]